MSSQNSFRCDKLDVATEEFGAKILVFAGTNN